MIKSDTFYMMVIYKEFLYYTEKVLKEMGLNFGQIPFILYIGKNENCTPSDVKNNLKMDWGHVQRSLSKLENEGFVNKYKENDNKRNYSLKLTKSGKTAFEKCHDVFYSWDEELKDTITEEEWKDFETLLYKIFDNRKRRWSDGKI